MTTHTEAFSIGAVHNLLVPGIKASEESLAATLASNSAQEVSTVDLLVMQMDMSNWTLRVQLSSAVIKELTETMKSVVQKM